MRDQTAWWVSRDGRRQNSWGGTPIGSGKCACGLTMTCVDPNYVSRPSVLQILKYCIFSSTATATLTRKNGILTKALFTKKTFFRRVNR